MEVLHGDIRITLSDEDAIRGLERTRTSVKRQMARISREKAVIKIEGDIRELEKDLVQAERRLLKFKGMDAEVKLGIREGDFKKDIKEAQLQLDALKGQKIDLQVDLKGQKAALAQVKALQAAHHRNQEAVEKYNAAVESAIRSDQRQAQQYGRMQAQAMRMDDQRSRSVQDNIQKEGQMRHRAEGAMLRDLDTRERKERSMVRTQQQAIDMDHRRGLEVAKLRNEYDKANQALQRIQQTNNRLAKRVGRAAHPERDLELDLKTTHLIEQMAAIRAKLAAMNAKPIEIPVNMEQSRALERLLGIGDIGMRLGPFTGTLKQFTGAALLLGPILTGLVGTVGALAGAVGTGLTGAIGIAASGLAGFGLTLGGVGLLTVSLFRDFKNLNTMQSAYHKQVLKTGVDSDKAKTKLQEFNHALGEVTPTTRAAFMSLDALQDRWRGLRKEARPDFFDALGQAILTVNTDFGIFSRETLRAFHVVSVGFQNWMKGLRSAEGQNVIFTIMRNTTEGVKELLPALGHLGAAFGRVTESFSRHFKPLLSDFNAWTAGIDNATTHTDSLNTGVDHLVDSFKDVLGVATAFGNVLIEMGRAAMGPGGDLMDNIANGLNDIADSIHNNPKPLKDFFSESIGTVKALYNVLQPLLQLFMEFSTILRPATTAVLSLISPLAELTQFLAGLGPIRAALQAWATLWLFRRGSAMAVGLLAGSVNALAVATERLGKAKLTAGLTSIAGGLRGAPVPPGAVSPGGVQSRYKVPVGFGGPARGLPVSPVAAGGGFARAFGAVGRGLGALTVGLLGVSPPVAALGAIAIGAAIGIKKLRDAANDRAEADRRASQVLGPKAAKRPSLKDFAAQLPDNRAAGLPGSALPGNVQIEAWRKYRDAAVSAIDDVNKAVIESGQIQREMVGAGSQLQNSRLMVEQAEKAYAAAVKQSGKNSLEARIALQQLRDARTAESESARNWGDTSEKAGDKVRGAVTDAYAAFKKASDAGSPFADVLRKRLDSAKNSAAAFDINVRRAKKGLDIFTGAGSEKIGALVREFGNLPGLKRTLIQADTQGAAQKIAGVVRDLAAIGQKRAVVRILADADNPKEALRLLNAALDKWEKRHPVAELRANRAQAEKELQSANKQLTLYGARKPEAALKARDEAQDKLDRLNKQLDHLDGKSATVTANVKFTLPSNFTTDATGGNSTGGDGWGVPDIAKAVKGYAESHQGAMTDMMMKSGGIIGGLPASGSGLNAFNSIAQRFGLTVGSGFRPGAVTSAGNTSYHAMGRARDFPGAPAQMMAFARFMAATFGARLKELIYTPLGFSIKNGKRVAPYAQADHYDHVHVAMATGGMAGGKGQTRSEARSGRYTKPTVLFAEEAGHPEYFISTNPRDKRRSQHLIIDAANEIGGLKEHDKGFFPMASGGGFGFAVGGQAADRGQKNVIFQAIRIARQLGAGRKATRALLMAIMHESRARNLHGGDASSSGILQVLASTGRSMGINPRDKAAVIKAFLTRGFYGKGSAINLAKNKSLSASEVAHLVQGNATGTGVYRAESGNTDSALRAFARLNGAGGGGGGAPAEPRRHGARSNIANMLAWTQGQLDWATGTPNNFQDDIRAIFGYTQKARGTAHHTAPNRLAGSGSTKSRHIPGLIGTLGKQSTAARERVAVIDQALAGKLRPSHRKDLLAEKEQLTGTLAGNRTQIRDLREQGAEARFERKMRKSGVGAAIDIDSRVANAASTGTLDDDIAAAQAQAKYYAAREKWAKGRGNKEKATEARNSYNQATEQIRTLTSQKFEDYLSLAENQASLTVSLADDFKAASNEVTYWKAKIAEAHKRGDVAGEAAATANLNTYVERANSLSEDMKRLPLERDLALAQLTDGIEDDNKATIALRDYWKTRLDEALKSGDIPAQIEAAGNLKNLNDEIQSAQENIATQMVLLTTARRDLYREFGSNFLPIFAQGAPQGVAATSGTTINMTVNGATLGSDPHTWSQNVAWELQAAV